MRYINENDTEQIIKIHSTLEREKDRYNASYNDVVNYICPDRITSSVYGDTSVRRTNTPDRTELFDKNVVLAKKIYDSYKASVLTPPDSTWLYITTDNDELNKEKEVQIFCEKERDAIKKNLDNSNFYDENNKVFYDNSAFGPGILFVERSYSDSSNIVCTAMDIFECEIDTNAEGEVDVLMRKTQKTARQVIEEFGEENVSDDLKKKFEKDPEEYITLLNAVFPRDIYKDKKTKKASKESPFVSKWIELDTKHTLRISGYNTFPYICAIMPRSVGDKYGSSICIDIMPSIKMVNEIAKTIIKNAQYMAEPPLVANSAAIENWEDLEESGVTPGMIVPVIVGQSGILRDQILPIITSNPQFNVVLELYEKEIESIRNAFANNQITLPGLTTEKTATEVHVRKLDQARVMSPEYSCYQRYLSKLVERVIDILSEIPGELPTLPEVLMNSKANYRIQFVSQLTKSQKILEVQSMLELIQTTLQVSQIFPQALDMIDIDYVITHIAEITNVPPQVVKSMKEVKKIREIKVQQLMQERQLQLAQQAAATYKDAAKAGKDMPEDMKNMGEQLQ